MNRIGVALAMVHPTPNQTMMENGNLGMLSYVVAAAGADTHGTANLDSESEEGDLQMLLPTP